MDVGGVVAAVVPYLSALAGAYGSTVVQRVTEESSEAAADATVGLGRRLLRRLLASPASREAIQTAVTDLGEHPDDEDYRACVRVQVGKALRGDPDLANQIVQMLAGAGTPSGKFTVSVSGSQGVQIGDHNTQTNTFGTTPR